MLFTRDELLTKIKLGEDSLFELKAVRTAGEKLRGPDQDTIANEIAALANTSGGTILIGVDDDGSVSGIPVSVLKKMELRIQAACQQSIQPSLAPIIEIMTLPDYETMEERPIIRIEVSPSLFVHKSPGGYKHRVGSGTIDMAPDQLARLLQQRSQSRLIRFDETPVMEAPLSALVDELWQRFAPGATTDPREVVLHKLALVREAQDKQLHPTISGLLLACRDPQVYLKGSYIQAVAYRGTTIAPEDNDTVYQQDAKNITGPLDEQVLQACDFVKRNMRISAIKHQDGGREDIPQFDMLAVFEAVVNAVAHRDYSMPGSKVRIRLFDDRLEIYSPGMLPNTMTTDSLPFRQAARNEVLTSLLARCSIPSDKKNLTHRTSMMDKRGEGVSLILQRSEKLSGIKPKYEILDRSELRLTIYSRKNYG